MKINLKAEIIQSLFLSYFTSLYGLTQEEQVVDNYLHKNEKGSQVNWDEACF